MSENKKVSLPVLEEAGYQTTGVQVEYLYGDTDYELGNNCTFKNGELILDGKRIASNGQFTQSGYMFGEDYTEPNTALVISRANNTKHPIVRG